MNIPLSRLPAQRLLTWIFFGLWTALCLGSPYNLLRNMAPENRLPGFWLLLSLAMAPLPFAGIVSLRKTFNNVSYFFISLGILLLAGSTLMADNLDPSTSEPVKLSAYEGLGRASMMAIVSVLTLFLIGNPWGKVKFKDWWFRTESDTVVSIFLCSVATICMTAQNWVLLMDALTVPRSPTLGADAGVVMMSILGMVTLAVDLCCQE